MKKRCLLPFAFALTLASCEHQSHHVVTTAHHDDTVLEGHVIASNPIIIKKSGSDELPAALFITDGPLSAGLFENLPQSKDKKKPAADGIHYSIKLKNVYISDQCSYPSLICKALSSAKNSRILNVVKDKNSKIEVGKKVYVVLSGNHGHLLQE